MIGLAAAAGCYTTSGAGLFKHTGGGFTYISTEMLPVTVTFGAPSEAMRLTSRRTGWRRDEKKLRSPSAARRSSWC